MMRCQAIFNLAFALCAGYSSTEAGAVGPNPALQKIAASANTSTRPPAIYRNHSKGGLHRLLDPVERNPRILYAEDKDMAGHVKYAKKRAKGGLHQLLDPVERNPQILYAADNEMARLVKRAKMFKENPGNQGLRNEMEELRASVKASLTRGKTRLTKRQSLSQIPGRALEISRAGEERALAKAVANTRGDEPSEVANATAATASIPDNEIPLTDWNPSPEERTRVNIAFLGSQITYKSETSASPSYQDVNGQLEKRGWTRVYRLTRDTNSMASEAVFVKDDTQALKRTILIAFRGTKISFTRFDVGDLFSDLNQYCTSSGNAAGFQNAVDRIFSGLVDVIEPLATDDRFQKVEFIVTGHSLGGPIAKIFAETGINKFLADHIVESDQDIVQESADQDDNLADHMVVGIPAPVHDEIKDRYDVHVITFASASRQNVPHATVVDFLCERDPICHYHSAVDQKWIQGVRGTEGGPHKTTIIIPRGDHYLESFYGEELRGHAADAVGIPRWAFLDYIQGGGLKPRGHTVGTQTVDAAAAPAGTANSRDLPDEGHESD